MIEIHGKNVEITTAMRDTAKDNIQINLVDKYKGVKFKSGHITVESVGDGYQVSTFLSTHIGDFKLKKTLEDFYYDFNSYTKILGRQIREKERKIIDTGRQPIEHEDPEYIEEIAIRVI